MHMSVHDCSKLEAFAADYADHPGNPFATLEIRVRRAEPNHLHGVHPSVTLFFASYAEAKGYADAINAAAVSTAHPVLKLVEASQ